jgi:transcriptional regulator
MNIMYTPTFNQIADHSILIEAMRAYSFAILFGAPSGHEEGSSPVATHLPLVVKDEGPHGILEGHFARANRHWQTHAGCETLAVFSGPHTYVSPTFYDDPLSVPTWNYIAVHAYGPLELIDDEPGKDAVLTGLMQVHEPAMIESWRNMPVSFRSSMLAGIVAFRIPILHIEGKFKISQNRSQAERRTIQNAHASGSPDQQVLASWMARLGG